MPKKSEPKTEIKPYIEDGNIEAHIIADMLRIESITAEIREFKEVTKSRLDKLENWTYTKLEESKRIAGIIKKRIIERKNES